MVEKLKDLAMRMLPSINNFKINFTSQRIWVLIGLALVFVILTVSYLYFSHITWNCRSGDCQNGEGESLANDGSRYIGGFKKQKKSGFGVLVTPKNSIYKGDWVNDKPHGFGILEESGGGVYEGMFFQGRKSGYGKYTWSDGTILQGNWEQGEPNGRLTLTLPDGQKMVGIYTQGVIVEGEGVYIYDNGDRYIGHWHKRRRHGEGKLLGASGEIIHSGRWEEDRLIK